MFLIFECSRHRDREEWQNYEHFQIFIFSQLSELQIFEEIDSHEKQIVIKCFKEILFSNFVTLREREKTRNSWYTAIQREMYTNFS